MVLPGRHVPGYIVVSRNRPAPQLPSQRPAGVRHGPSSVVVRTHRHAARLVLPIVPVRSRRRYGARPHWDARRSVQPAPGDGEEQTPGVLVRARPGHAVLQRTTSISRCTSMWSAERCCRSMPSPARSGTTTSSTTQTQASLIFADVLHLLRARLLPVRASAVLYLRRHLRASGLQDVHGRGVVVYGWMFIIADVGYGGASRFRTRGGLALPLVDRYFIVHRRRMVHHPWYRHA